MANNIKIKLDMKRLKQLEQQAPGRTDQIVRKIGTDLAAYVMGHFTESVSAPGEAPGVVTGNLKNNIHMTPTGQGKVRVSADTEYASMLEFGTVKMAARPFMMPAAEAITPMIPSYFKATLLK